MGCTSKDHHEWVARCLVCPLSARSVLAGSIHLFLQNVPGSLLTLHPVFVTLHFYPYALTLPCYVAEADSPYSSPGDSSNARRIECLTTSTLLASVLTGLVSCNSAT